jgi:hypothetical protein
MFSLFASCAEVSAAQKRHFWGDISESKTYVQIAAMIEKR